MGTPLLSYEIFVLFLRWFIDIQNGLPLIGTPAILLLQSIYITLLLFYALFLYGSYIYSK